MLHTKISVCNGKVHFFVTPGYDINCAENCPADCKQAIPSMRHCFGQLIEKTNLLGHGGQGSVYACNWHGKEAAAKFIRNKGIDLEKYLGKNGDEKIPDPEL